MKTLRKKYLEDYENYLKSKNKIKTLTDYDKQHDEIPKHFNIINKNNFFGLSGVYFLIKDNKIVYVGESSCIFSRISQHYKEEIKNFDFFHYELYEGEINRKQKERKYIKKFRPIYNFTHNPNLK